MQTESYHNCEIVMIYVNPPNASVDRDGVVHAYLSNIGKRGGKVKSAAKSAAARANGKKGGRPRKANGNP